MQLSAEIKNVSAGAIFLLAGYNSCNGTKQDRQG